jgi:polygalacturonase
MSGGVKNLHVSDLTFIGTDVGLRFKSTRGRGGVVENIYISDINMINIPAEAILFDLYYTGNSPILEGDEKVTAEDKEKMAASVPPVSEETPSLKNIFIKDVICKGAGRAVLFQGLPEMNLMNMNIENVKIDAAKGLYCIDSDGVSMKNVTITASSGPAMFFYNSKNVLVDGFQPKDQHEKLISVTGPLTS